MIRDTRGTDQPIARPPLATRLGRRKGLLILGLVLAAGAALATPRMGYRHGGVLIAFRAG